VDGRATWEVSRTHGKSGSSNPIFNFFWDQGRKRYRAKSPDRQRQKRCKIAGSEKTRAQKALSIDASYLNFSLQQSIGVQFRLADRWDFRAGIADFHFSNGFMVPNNPGIDEMTYTGAGVYHLKVRSATH
jgi:hypothetical protein